MALELLLVVDVVVTNFFTAVAITLFCLYITNSYAAILPADRADLLYHSYDGGGVEVNGPSLLVRKSIGDEFSVSGNYYIDNVSSASIDVITSGASPYTEQRTETSLSLDYLRDKVIMSAGYTSSVESDYDAKTGFFSISQDMFGDLTNIALSYSQGDNIVRRNGDDLFQDYANTRSYRISLSQVITKNMLLGAVFETMADEGYLNNPYRSVRFDDGSASGEVYPRTRTSNAGSIRLRYYLPYRAAIYGGVRTFADSWGINATDYEIGYVQPMWEKWLFDIKYRTYSQNNASFYNDLFPAGSTQNFKARDKELSTFDSQTIGVEASYEFINKGWGFIDKASASLAYDVIFFDYKDFRDARYSQSGEYAIGEEPFYSFSANVVRLFVSVWY